MAEIVFILVGDINPAKLLGDVCLKLFLLFWCVMVSKTGFAKEPAYTQEGSPVRIYIAEHAGETGYYMIEKGGKDAPAYVASVTEDGTHTKVEEAPDNGAEIEAIMSLIRPS